MTILLAQFLTMLLGASGVILFIIAVTLGLCMPLMALSVTRNVKRIRMALEQIAEMRAGGASDARPGRLGL